MITEPDGNCLVIPVAIHVTISPSYRGMPSCSCSRSFKKRQKSANDGVEMKWSEGCARKGDENCASSLGREARLYAFGRSMESAAVQNRIEHSGSMASYSQKLRPQEGLAGHGIAARSSGHVVTCRKTCSKHAMRTRPYFDAHAVGPRLGGMIPLAPTHRGMATGEDTSDGASARGRHNGASTGGLKRNIKMT